MSWTEAVPVESYHGRILRDSTGAVGVHVAGGASCRGAFDSCFVVWLWADGVLESVSDLDLCPTLFQAN